MKVFHLPDLGEGLAEAEIREWYVKEGDAVTVDQPLVSMETAKAVVDVPSPYAGKIIKLHGAANDIIKTGAPFISFETEEKESGTPKKNSVVGALEESAHKWQEEAVIIGRPETKTQSIKAMPAARVLAKELQIDLGSVKPTGPQGLITPADVKAFFANQNPSTQNSTSQKSSLPDQQGGRVEPLRGVRRHMAQAMVQSHQEIVPVTIVDDADLTDLPTNVDLTVLIIQAIVAGIKKEPALNAWFDGKALARRLFDDINIGLAVDSDEGLFVPVIKNADKLSTEDLRLAIDQYKKSVASRTVAASDMQGATISLSNFGSIAGKYATPIIVPPAVAILGCGRSKSLPVIKGDKIVPGKILPLSLTFDHRAVTGGEATRFLRGIIDHIQQK